MQPYLFPYIGYFQLINAVDSFVVYDNIKYTKKGWINRNRILLNGRDEYITLPLKRGSDFLNINERFLSDTWTKEKLQLLNKIREAYRKAPHFPKVYPIVEQCLYYEQSNLFLFIFNSLSVLCKYMRIKTPLVVSSDITIDHSLRAEQRVMAICKALNADTYINPIGGLELYSKGDFRKNGIQLQFLKAGDINYNQQNSQFIPFLSIIDVLMFNSDEEVNTILNSSYSLI